MPHRVADELIRRLAEAGVERIYGVVGDSLNPVTDALRLNGKMKFIHVRHEETGAFAAGAEAQLTGKLAACAGSCGPGNLHLINGLFDAHRSNAPVLAIASHIPSSEIGTGYFQETHPEILFKECSHYCELISNTKQFERVLHIAMQSALGKGGVGVIVLPGDVGGADLPAEGSPRSLVSRRPTVRPGEKDLARLAELINSSKKVALLCGIGCDNAHDEVVALAEKVKSPVGHTYRGKPFVEYSNPYDVGMTGLIGFGMAYEAIHECDLLLLLGTDFPYDKFLPTKPKIAQILTVWDGEANSISEFGAMCARRCKRCCRCWIQSRTGNSSIPSSANTKRRFEKSMCTLITWENARPCTRSPWQRR